MSVKNNDGINSEDELILKYGGKWVLRKNNKIIFADEDFSKVMDKAIELQVDPDNSEIEFIDSGDAVFYGTRI